MPLETRIISDKSSKASSISLRDLLKIAFYTIRDYAIETQGIMEVQRAGYIKDLVTEPTKRLSSRHDLKIYPSLSEAIIVSVAFRMMNDSRMLEYPPEHKGRVMRVKDDISEETIADFLEDAESHLGSNDWLYRMINQYLTPGCQHKSNR